MPETVEGDNVMMDTWPGGAWRGKARIEKQRTVNMQFIGLLFLVAACVCAGVGCWATHRIRAGWKWSVRDEQHWI